MINRLIICVAVAAGLLTLCVFGVILFRHRGIEVEIRNTGTQTMVNVEVELGGQQIKLGDIIAGSSASRRIVPATTSSANVTFSDAAGQRKTINLDVYVERGFRGRIVAEIADGELQGRVENTSIGILP